MPGMLALTTMEPIAGVDIHESLPPIPTAPLPHVVVWGTGLSLKMGLPQALTASQAMSPDHKKYYAKPIAVGLGHACGRGHDAGVHFGHIAGNTLLAVIWLGAASKSEFGSGTVLVQGNHMAAHLMLFMNLQLHCCDPAPLPMGFSFATGSNLVFANLAFIDIVAGFVHMIVDIAFVVVLNFALKGIGSALGRLWKGTGMTGLLSDLAKGVVNDLEDIFVRKLSNGKRVMDWSKITPKGFAKQFGQWFANHRWNAEGFNSSIAPKALAKIVGGTVPGWLVGSPTGASAVPYDSATPDANVSPGSKASSKTDDAVDRIFY
jgi:hypothetical protein